MARRKGEILFEMGLKDSKFLAGTRRVNSAIIDVKSQWSGFKKTVGGGIAIGATVAAFISLRRAIGDSVTEAVELEKTIAIMGKLTGSTEKAVSILEELKSFPIRVEGSDQAARALLAFGESTEDVVGTTRKLADVAAFTGINLKELADIYGKSRVQNTLFAEDINQLTNRGIPVIEEFAEILGVPTNEIKKMGSEGKITFATLEKAFDNLTGKGGKFEGGLDAISKTTAGMIANLKGIALESKRAFGSELLRALIGNTEDANNNLSAMGDAFIEIAAVGGETIGELTSLFGGLAADMSRAGVLGIIPNLFIGAFDDLLDASAAVREADEALEDFEARNKDRLAEQRGEVTAVVEQIERLRDEWRKTSQELLQSGTNGFQKFERERAFGNFVGNFDAVKGELSLVTKQVLALQAQIQKGVDPFGLDLGSFKDLDRVRNAIDNSLSSSLRESLSDETRPVLDKLLAELEDRLGRVSELNEELVRNANADAAAQLDFESRVSLAEARGDVDASRKLRIEQLTGAFQAQNVEAQVALDLARKTIAMEDEVARIAERKAEGASREQAATIRREIDLNEAIAAQRLDVARTLELDAAREELKGRLVTMTDAEAEALRRVQHETGLATQNDRERLDNYAEQLAEVERLAQKKIRSSVEIDLQARGGFDIERLKRIGSESLFELNDADLQRSLSVRRLIEDLQRAGAEAADDEKQAIAAITVELKEQLRVLHEQETIQRALERAEKARTKGRTTTFDQDESAERRRLKTNQRQLEDAIEREEFFQDAREKRDGKRDDADLNRLNQQLEEIRKKRGDDRSKEQRRQERERKEFLDGGGGFGGLDALDHGDLPDVQPRHFVPAQLPPPPAPPLPDPDRDPLGKPDADFIEPEMFSELVTLARERNKTLEQTRQILDSRLPAQAT